MVVVLAYAVTLLFAVLLSEVAHRSVLSGSVIFLVAGVLLALIGVEKLTPDDPVVGRLPDLALFSVLFTDGMRVGVRDLTEAWRLPGRALLLGLPLTLLGTAILAHTITGALVHGCSGRELVS